jgi:hypothetical protein
MTRGTALALVKGLHTVVWALLVGCIVGMPIAALWGRFTVAAGLGGVVLVEVLVLAVNRMRCPLTDLAARFTEERADNFDIYLPLWLASNNKRVFGTLFVVGGLVSAWAWWR